MFMNLRQPSENIVVVIHTKKKRDKRFLVCILEMCMPASK